MDNQSLLEDTERKNVATCSTSADIQMRIFKGRHRPTEMASSSEIVSSLDQEYGKVNIKRGGTRTSTRSMTDPGILMTVNHKGHKLNDRFRYHVFIIYYQVDRIWVNSLVKRLESPPHEYKCCIDSRDFNSSQSTIQNVVCSLMLSERVILVLCKDFFTKMWPTLEDCILNITGPTFQLSSKIIGILMEKIDIDTTFPDALRGVNILYSYDDQFWQLLLMNLKRDTSTVYTSSSTLWSLVSQTTPLLNGQILFMINVQIQGLIKPRFKIKIEALPQSGPFQESAVNDLITEDMFEFILDSLQLTDSTLTCFDSSWPSIMIFLFSLIWLASFLSVILKLPDSKPYTLPTRLSVFIIPAVVLLLLIIHRWRSVENNKTKLLTNIFYRSSFLNAQLFKKNRNVITTCARTGKLNIYVIYLVYYSLSQCGETVRHFCNTFRDSEIEKLKQLLKFFQHQALPTDPILTISFSDELCLFMSSSYLFHFLAHNLPPLLQQRHTRKYQCLCQYIEDFFSLYIPIIKQPNKFSIKYIETVLQRFIHSTVVISSSSLKSLGLYSSISQSYASTSSI